MQHLINCTCGQQMVKSVEGRTKIVAKIVVITDDRTFAVCKSCDKEVAVPLILDMPLLKSMSKPTVPPRHFIRDMKKS